ncbi:response regulator transcription factor [Novosphingobium pituita]|uniref:Response regulator AgmR n=1 Tax=Novosphingobium pituita TaxID=3056842 RepID=A0ABQ6P1U9_9SPHN|nr:response regulator transcription factor [Novosphingobium sp. IK01]GMM59230.1 response regulator AgmR [Novosphingobium sp. IK01]
MLDSPQERSGADCMPRSLSRVGVASAALRLLIADDHPIFRSGLQWALEQFDEVAEVRVASTFEDLMAVLPEWMPDIVILDLHMPTLSAPESLRLLRQNHGRLPVLILSASGDAEDVIDTLRAGASGYITKASEVSELLGAVQVILDGGVFLPDGIIGGIGGIGGQGIGGQGIGRQGIGSRRGEPLSPPAPDALSSPAVPRLTRRQHEVLSLTLQGQANKVIAHNLSMSEGTVKTHLSAVMRLYGVNNRVQLLRAVERLGYRS